MARFNSKKAPAYAAQETKNLAGGPAYTQSWKEELVSLLLTSMVQDQFYRSAQGGVQRLTDLVKNQTGYEDRKFVGKAGIFARNEFGMRSISHLLAATVGLNYKGLVWTKDFFNKIVRRPDDMTEIMTLIMKAGAPLPNALKKGFANALQKFDAYQLAKYRQETQALKLVDVVNLTHPVPTEPISLLVNNQLQPADTWETGLSKAGQITDVTEKGAAKEQAWIDLLRNRRLGYMALLKNLRNILTQVDLGKMYPTVGGTKTGLEMVVEQLTDMAAIKKSLVLPFRFATAYDELSKTVTGKYGYAILEAIDKAATLALSNVPKFAGGTLIMIDQSGSMTGKVGTSNAAKVGGLFAAMLWKTNEDCDVIAFGSNARYVAPQHRNNSLLNLANTLGDPSMGGTDFSAPFRLARAPYDRIIILSDMQGWIDEKSAFQGGFKDYMKRFGVKPHLYSFDLCGYGSLQFPEDRTYLLAGFSDKIFDVMKVLETDRRALIHKIEAIVL